MVLALVILPPVGALLNAATDGVSEGTSGPDIAYALALTLAKVGIFVAVMLVVGRRVIPWILHYVAHTGSRELFWPSDLVSLSVRRKQKPPGGGELPCDVTREKLRNA